MDATQLATLVAAINLGTMATVGMTCALIVAVSWKG